MVWRTLQVLLGSDSAKMAIYNLSLLLSKVQSIKVIIGSNGIVMGTVWLIYLWTNILLNKSDLKFMFI